ncbi:hypothetical protein [Nakamurella antarctica]|uniref:hypothetical protein n=1 Tax=Nakamurella antarctica TaxID=1902245 RepID=UPI0013DDB785|nr:hypothetical protein [Nakamurella antarctica]
MVLPGREDPLLVDYLTAAVTNIRLSFTVSMGHASGSVRNRGELWALAAAAEADLAQRKGRTRRGAGHAALPSHRPTAMGTGKTTSVYRAPEAPTGGHRGPHRRGSSRERENVHGEMG